MLAFFSGRRPAVAPWLRVSAVLGATLALGACEGDELIDPPFRDGVAPRVTLVKGNAVADSLLNMKVNATDNIGLKTVRVLLSGGVTAAYDTTITTAVTKFDLDLAVRVPTSALLGATVNVRSIVIDGAGNESDTARLVLTVGNLEPPTAVITSPKAGSPVVSGKALVLSLSGRAKFKVRTLGYQISGAYSKRDSVPAPTPLRDSVAALDTLVLPDTITGKTITVTPFVIDSLNQRVNGVAVSYAVQSRANAQTEPVVTLGVTPRVEVSDTIFVEATDPVGISTLGYEVKSLSGTVLVSDSITSNGDLTTLQRTFQARLPISVFPTTVTVTGFARNANGTRQTVRTASGAILNDTLTVVAGTTQPLPNGGLVADALYFARNDRLYLSNIDRNQLEVFDLTAGTFGAPIIVGSRPWGLTVWPRNRSGDQGDTILVANSGGTNISYVDLRAGSNGREVFRYALPNIVAFTITTVRAAASDQLIQQRTVHDFSDRPQYVAATCQGSASASTPCGDVLLMYSTTPTPGQTMPFPNKGTVRWENLTRRTSHFFFEQAMGQSQGRSDTLEIIRYAADGFGSDSVLVPYIQQIPRGDGTSFPYSVVVRINELGFRDTTYVRSSGNFQRAVVGEGGPVLGSRALSYDVTRGFDLTPPLPVVDRGASRAMDVTDFIANTFARVEGVAINFDGQISAVKGDSTYLFDPTLRLQGLLESRPGQGGLDFHPLNRGANSTPLRSRLMFVGSSLPEVDIFDTYCYKKIAAVPVRDPVIGPVRVALRPNGQLVVVATTRRGVTLIPLPDSFTTTCQ